MRRFIIITLCLFSTVLTFAGKVTEQQALDKARRFMSDKQFSIKSVITRSQQNKEKSDAYYIFNALNNGGFVIISGDDRTEDILGYSRNGVLDTSNPGIAWLLATYEQVIKNLPANYRKKNITRSISKGDNISPLIQTQWNQGVVDLQGDVYNNLCPKINGYYCYTGCVATAMAQIINYHNYANITTDIPGYTWRSYDNSTIESLPPTNFTWDNGVLTTDNGIAKLMQYCGHSVGMQYGLSESEATFENCLNSFVQFFGYSKKIKTANRSNYNNDEWENLIYKELAESRPVMYSGYLVNNYVGIGHAFICDGYENGLFHINWGWGEYNNNGDGYYNLNILEARSDLSFSSRQTITYGIQKPQENEVIQNDTEVIIEDISLSLTDPDREFASYTYYSRDKQLMFDQNDIQLSARYSNHSFEDIHNYRGYLGVYYNDELVGTINTGNYILTLHPGMYVTLPFGGGNNTIYIDFFEKWFTNEETTTFNIYPIQLNSQEEWEKMKGCNKYIELVLNPSQAHPNAGSAKLTLYPQSDIVCSVSFDENTMSVTATNNGDELNGKISIKVNDNHAFERGIYLKNGESQSLSFNYSPQSGEKIIIMYNDKTIYQTAIRFLQVVANNFNREYGEENPEFTFIKETSLSIPTPIYNCEADINSNVGSYDIIPQGVSFINETENGVNITYILKYCKGILSVTKAPLTINAGEYTKIQGEDNPNFIATYEGFKNGETADVLTTKPTISCEATKDSAVGEYTVTVSGAEATNYDISYIEGKITIIEPSVTVTATDYCRAYGDQNPTFEYTSVGESLNGEPSISCEATVISPVGTYPINVSQGSITNNGVKYVNGILTVSKAPLTITAKSYTIMQGESLPAFEFEYVGFKNNETSEVLTAQPSVATIATSNSAPGTYDIVISSAEAQNYEITYINGKLTITEAPVTITAKSYTRVYGEANPTFEYTTEGATLNGTPSITCEATATSPVGTYTITIAKGNVTNSEVTYTNGTLTITKAPLTIKAGEYTKKQGEDNPTFTAIYEGFKNNETADVLTTKPTISCEATKNSAVGEYTVTVSGAEATNYEISYVNGKLTITEAQTQTSIKLTAKSYTRVYGAANPTFEYTTEGGTLNGTPSITCEATATSPVGTYTITIAKGSVTNSDVTYTNGTLTITKAPLKVSVGSYEIIEGEAIPAFDVKYEGFVNNETADVLTTKPTISCEATQNSPAGEYKVKASGAESKNYEITYVNGKLIILAKKFEAGGDDNKDEDDAATYQITSQGGGSDTTPTVAITDDKDVADAFAIPETVTYNNKTYTVTEIGEGTFENNTNLKEVSIPSSIISIGDKAFKGCSNLKSITVYITTPISLAVAGTRGAMTRADGNSVFDGVNKSTCILYVPEGSVDLYKVAPVWKDFQNILAIGTTGIKEIIMTDGEYHDIYDLQGRKVKAKATSLDGLPNGIYIVNGKKIILK